MRIYKKAVSMGGFFAVDVCFSVFSDLGRNRRVPDSGGLKSRCVMFDFRQAFQNPQEIEAYVDRAKDLF